MMKTLNRIDSVQGSGSIKTVLWILLLLLAVSSIFALFERQKEMRTPHNVKPVDLIAALSGPGAEETLADQNEITDLPESVLLEEIDAPALLTAPLIQPEPEKAAESKVDYLLSAEDVTRIQSPRAVNITAGVMYKVTDKSKIGVEASQEVYDFQDAKAWGKDYEDSQEARVKYKVAF